MGTDQRGISGKYFNKPKVIAQLELVTTFATYCSRWFQTFSKILQETAPLTKIRFFFFLQPFSLLVCKKIFIRMKRATRCYC